MCFRMYVPGHGAIVSLRDNGFVWVRFFSTDITSLRDALVGRGYPIATDITSLRDSRVDNVVRKNHQTFNGTRPIGTKCR